MVDKPIISIGVDHVQFDDFVKLFNAYTDAQAKSNALWGETNSQIDKAGKASQKFSSMFASIGKDAKTISGHILDATKSFLKWGTVLSAITGLLGVGGGLWGISSLASRVSAGQREATGLGTTPGNQSALTTAFSRYINASNALAAAQKAKTDVSSPEAIAGSIAGVTDAERRGDTADQVVRLIQDMPGLFKQAGDEGLLSPLMTSDKITSRFSQDELQRLYTEWKSGNWKNVLDLVPLYEDYKKRFEIPKDVSEKWQKLQTQLEASGQEIYTILAVRLAPLAGPLGDLSEALLGLVKSLAGDGSLDHIVAELKGGIIWMTAELKSDEFKSAITELWHGLVHVGDQVLAFSRAIGDFMNSKGFKILFGSKEESIAAQNQVGEGIIKWGVGKMLDAFNNILGSRVDKDKIDQQARDTAKWVTSGMGLGLWGGLGPSVGGPAMGYPSAPYSGGGGGGGGGGGSRGGGARPPSDDVSDDARRRYMDVYAKAKALGDPYPEITASQWAAESNFGASPVAKNNYFGQTKDGVAAAGHWTEYGSEDEGLKDHVRRWKSRYGQYKNADEALHDISENYASDKSYEGRVGGIMRKMRRYLTGSAPAPITFGAGNPFAKKTFMPGGESNTSEYLKSLTHPPDAPAPLPNTMLRMRGTRGRLRDAIMKEHPELKAKPDASTPGGQSRADGPSAHEAMNHRWAGMQRFASVTIYNQAGGNTIHSMAALGLGTAV